MVTQLTRQDVMIHILSTLPKAYNTTIDMAEKDLMVGSLTNEGLQELLFTKYKKIKGGNKDVSLFTKQCKGTCNICFKMGHKSVNCLSLPQNKSKKE